MRRTQDVTRDALAILAVGALALLGGTGCRSTAGIEATGAVYHPVGDTQMSKFVQINNSSLARGMQIVDMRQRTTESNLMEVSVSLVSKSRRTLTFQHRFAWYDAAGFEVEPDTTSWKPMIIYGNESRTIQSIAPNSSAKEFRLKIRAR